MRTFRNYADDPALGYLNDSSAQQLHFANFRQTPERLRSGGVQGQSLNHHQSGHADNGALDLRETYLQKFVLKKCWGNQ